MEVNYKSIHIMPKLFKGLLVRFKVYITVDFVCRPTQLDLSLWFKYYWLYSTTGFYLNPFDISIHSKASQPSGIVSVLYIFLSFPCFFRVKTIGITATHKVSILQHAIYNDRKQIAFRSFAFP